MSTKKLQQLHEELETILEFYYTELPENESVSIDLLVNIDKKCNEIIAIHPFDERARDIKFAVNSDELFFNTNELIENAEFIIEHDEFSFTNKTNAYTNLAIIYSETLALPKKAINVLESLLLFIQSSNIPHYEKASLKSEALNKIAYIYAECDEYEKAIKNWQESYNLDSLIYERNMSASLYLLENKKFTEATPFLRSYLQWTYDYNDTSQQAVSQILKELYNTGEINEHPQIINVMHDLIRNNTSFHKIEGTLDYVNQYLPKLLEEAERFKNYSSLWMTVGNTYFFDLNDFDNAYNAYLKCLQGNEPNYSYAVYPRIKYCCEKIGKDFFALPFYTEGSPISQYNVLTLLSNFHEEPYSYGYDFESDDENDNSNEEYDIRYLQLAAKYGEACFTQFKTYFDTGKSVKDCNAPHMFAMCCNNYGIVLEELESLKETEEYDKVEMKRISKIHAEGYHYSPFHENLKHQYEALYKSGEIDKCIPIILKYQENYSDVMGHYYLQKSYKDLIACYYYNEDFKNIEQTYCKAKKSYLDFIEEKEFELEDENIQQLLEDFNDLDEDDTEDILDLFSENALTYYSHKANLEDDHMKIFQEVKWILKQGILENYPFRNGEAHYYAGLGYASEKETKRALIHFEKSRKLLKESDEEMHQYILEDIDAVSFSLVKNKVKGWFKRS